MRARRDAEGDARARARERRKLAASKRGKLGGQSRKTAAVWDGEAEDEAKQKQRKESGVLCWSCGGISEDASRALYRT